MRAIFSKFGPFCNTANRLIYESPVVDNRGAHICPNRAAGVIFTQREICRKAEMTNAPQGLESSRRRNARLSRQKG